MSDDRLWWNYARLRSGEYWVKEYDHLCNTSEERCRQRMALLTTFTDEHIRTPRQRYEILRWCEGRLRKVRTEALNRDHT